MDVMERERQWFAAFNPYGGAFELAKPDYGKLDETTQIYGALMKLELDIYNGGFIQFFCNWGYDAYLLAVRGLERIGALTAKGIVEKEYSILDKYEDDERLVTMWDLPTVLTGEEQAQLEELDEQYWEDTDEVMERMLGCISKK